MPTKSGKASAKKPAAKGRGRPPASAKARKPTKPFANQYKKYIHAVQKKVHPNHTMSKKSMSIFNNFVMDTLHSICSEASQLTARNKTKTLGGREIECAVKILLPGELAFHAGNEGAKAVARYGM